MKRLIVLCLLFCGLAFSQTVTFTIAESASLSGAVDFKACTMARIIMNPDASGTGWTTANLTFQHSADGVTYGNVYDQFGNEVTVTVPTAASSAAVTIILSPGDWWNVRYVKIRSGTSGTAVNQAAARTIKVVCR